MEPKKKMTTKTKGFKWKQLSPKAWDYVYNSDAFINLAVGSIRSSKTITSLLRFTHHMLSMDETPYAMAGNTLQSLRRNCIEPLTLMLDDLRIPCDVYMGKQEMVVDDCSIALFGLDKEGTDKKIKGYTSAGTYLDEITTMSESAFEMLISRNSLPGAKIFCTCNPVGPLHYVYQKYILKGLDPTYFKVWKFRLEDNLTLSKSYIDSLKALYPPDSVFYKRNILGEWVSGQGLIFDKFNEDNILRGSINLDDYDYFEVGSDYGTSTTTCYVLVGIRYDYSAVDGETILYDVIAEYGYDATKEASTQTDAERVDDIVNLQDTYGLNEDSIFDCSHDAESLKAALEKDNRVRMIIKTFMPDTLECIQTISSLFYQNSIRVHESCTELINQIYGYEWDMKAAAKGEDKPVKRDDHYIDAMRAPIMNNLPGKDEILGDFLYV